MMMTLRKLTSQALSHHQVWNRPFATREACPVPKTPPSISRRRPPYPGGPVPLTSNPPPVSQGNGRPASFHDPRRPIPYSAPLPALPQSQPASPLTTTFPARRDPAELTFYTPNNPYLRNHNQSYPHHEPPGPSLPPSTHVAGSEAGNTNPNPQMEQTRQNVIGPRGNQNVGSGHAGGNVAGEGVTGHDVGGNNGGHDGEDDDFDIDCPACKLQVTGEKRELLQSLVDWSVGSLILHSAKVVALVLWWKELFCNYNWSRIFWYTYKSSFVTFFGLHSLILVV